MFPSPYEVILLFCILKMRKSRLRRPVGSSVHVQSQLCQVSSHAPPASPLCLYKEHLKNSVMALEKGSRMVPKITFPCAYLQRTLELDSFFFHLFCQLKST